MCIVNTSVYNLLQLIVCIRHKINTPEDILIILKMVTLGWPGILILILLLFLQYQIVWYIIDSYYLSVNLLDGKILFFIFSKSQPMFIEHDASLVFWNSIYFHQGR